MKVKFWTTVKILAVVLVSFGALWALERFLNWGKGSWETSLQVGVTVVLVLVTFRYVQLTKALVDTSRNQFQHEMNFAAARDVLRGMGEMTDHLATLSNAFPILPGAPMPNLTDLEETQPPLQNYANRLLDQLPTLPRELRPVATKAMMAILTRQTDFLRFKNAVLVEQVRSLKAADSWQWSGVEKVYRADIKDHHCSYEDLLSGEWVKDLDKKMTALWVGSGKFLSGDGSSGFSGIASKPGDKGSDAKS